MAASILHIHPKHPEPRKIAQAVEILKSGGVAIYPTDTVYGVGCDLLNRRALERLCAAIDIEPKRLNPSFVCSELSEISEYIKPIDRMTFKTLARLLPGPYTFLLEASGKVAKVIKAGKKTVGVRIPDHAISRLLAKELGSPLASLSAKSDDAIATYISDPDRLYERFRHSVDLIIDGGVGGNEPSTVIDLTGATPQLVRQGKGTYSIE